MLAQALQCTHDTLTYLNFLVQIRSYDYVKKQPLLKI